MYVVIDIGGTNTRIGFSKNLKKIDKLVKFRTQHVFLSWVRKAVDVVEHELDGAIPKSTVVGIAGTVDRGKGVLLKSPHLLSWQKKPLARILSAKLKSKVILENDAALGALGEAVRGAGKGREIIAYVAIGTGVGGARVLHKRIDESVYGFEPGHQIIVPSGMRWSCGQKGCLDAHASGSAFVREFGKSPKEVKSRRVWKRYAEFLGPGIVNVIVMWSPDVVVIGGSFAKSKGFIMGPLREYVFSNLKIFPSPPIVLGKLEDTAGIYGGMELLRNARL